MQLYDNRKDFQGTYGVEIFNHFVKRGDSLALSTLLLTSRLIQVKIYKNLPLIAHDIGGADGAMMFALLHVLRLSAEVTANEPNVERCVQYRAKQEQHPIIFNKVETYHNKIEDEEFFIPGQRELILVSHMLYYTRDLWLSCDSLANHFLTKILTSLCPEGSLCVVIQQATLDKKHSHELWEDFIYPLIKKIKHSSNKFYATAEQFDTGLSAYRKQFIVETGSSIDWQVKTAIAETVVPLGDINTVANEEGAYLQSEEVLAILKFYLKGQAFDELNPIFQKKVIDILLAEFVDQYGQYKIVHYNKVYSIEMGPALFSHLKSLPSSGVTNVQTTNSK